MLRLMQSACQGSGWKEREFAPVRSGPERALKIEEIVTIEECRFRFRESSVDPVRNDLRYAVFEAC